jgi:hypothetical protein
MKSFLFGILTILSTCAIAQQDSLPYANYSRRLVLYSDFGFNTAPMSIKYPFANGLKEVKFRNNFNSVLGFGFSWKWISLRFGITLPNSGRSKSKYRKTQYYDLGFDFTFRNMFFDVDYHAYQGYTAKNAYKWNDSLTSDSPNQIRSDIGAASVSINAWQFFKNDFKMSAFRGKTAMYLRDVRSFYLKYTTNYHGLATTGGLPILPNELTDSLVDDKTRSTTIGAFDLGVVPGYAYVRRWRIFQLGIMGGVGLVLQSKFYIQNGATRSFLGLAPRVDIKIMAGINKPRYFIMFMGDFDNKSISFNELSYQQTFYMLKLYGGIRLNVTKKKEKQEAEAKEKASS